MWWSECKGFNKYKKFTTVYNLNCQHAESPLRLPGSINILIYHGNIV